MTERSPSPDGTSPGREPRAPASTADESLERLRDEMFRKLGRNLLNFQKAESLLKLMVPRMSVRGVPGEWEASLNRQVEGAQMSTLGCLIGKLLDLGLPASDEPDVHPDDAANGWMSVRFRLPVADGDEEVVRADLQWMLDQRNELVHHFLVRCLPESRERLEQACVWLDEQRERFRPIYDKLFDWVRGIAQAGQTMASAETADLMESLILRQSALAEALRDTAQKHARRDGWTYLSMGREAARRQAEDDFLHMKERYGYGLLSDFVRATDLFEVREEPTWNGGTQTMYRLKPPSDGPG